MLLKYKLLFVVIASVINISEKSYYPILNYLINQIKVGINYEDAISNMSRVAFVRVMKTFKTNR